MHLHAPACSCFRGLQNYTTLKLMMSIVTNGTCFRGLQNYTTLKRVNGCIHAKICFRGLQNYTTLKRQFVGFAK